MLDADKPKRMEEKKMKRYFWVATLCLLLLFSLAGCKEERNKEQTNSITEVYFEGQRSALGDQPNHLSRGYCTVDTSNKTILDPNNKSYSYSFKGSAIDITFPDGSVYTCEDGVAVRSREGTDGSSRSSIALDLATIIEKASNSGSVNARISNQALVTLFLCVILIGLGIFHAAAPKKAFEFTKGWRYENLEPSEHQLNLTQYCGVGMVLLGLSMILFVICH